MLTHTDPSFRPSDTRYAVGWIDAGHFRQLPLNPDGQPVAGSPGLASGAAGEAPAGGQGGPRAQSAPAVTQIDRYRRRGTSRCGLAQITPFGVWLPT
jgi:hypothetical protein